jgi:PKD repeat protein
MWMGSDLSTADEWVELTAVPVLSGTVITQHESLDGWTINQVKDGGSETVLARFTSQSIGSGQYLIISNFDAAHSRLAAEPAVISSSMSLPNTKLLLRLRSKSGALIDEIDDGIGSPFAGLNVSGQPKASMERIECRSSGAVTSNWRTAVAMNGWDASTTNIGTPGFMNGSSESVVLSKEITEEKIQVQPLTRPIISEILPDPIGTDDAEWVEFMNTQDSILDLRGWTIRSGSTSKTLAGSGLLIGARETKVIRAKDIGITLPNGGGVISLLYQGTLIDQIMYSSIVENVSIGRLSGTGTQLFCVPTPSVSNYLVATSINIHGLVASGPAPLTMNLQATASGGTLAAAKCHWQFGDGYVSESCNPPSHAIHTAGIIPIELSVINYCGNTMIQSATVYVFGKTPAQKSGPERQCTPTAFDGVSITEFMPRPHADEDEWIEIRNTSSGALSLCGWSVDDEKEGSKAFHLSDLVLGPGEYRMLSKAQTRIALNNDADMARLIAPLPGGGTGVLMFVAYQDAPAGESYALKSDDHWFWSQYPTPGSSNRFQEVNLLLGPPPVIIAAALPNPKGEDTWGEWVEFENLTGRPQWLNGWKLETASGKTLSLQGIVLAKREKLRIQLQGTKLSLANKSDAVKLIDTDGHIRSLVAWQKAKDGVIIYQFQAPSVMASKIKTVKGKFAFTSSGEVLELAGIDTNAAGFGENIESKNLFLSLINNKKIELKNDSIVKNRIYAFADGSDIGQILLQSGYAFVTGSYHFDRRLEFLAYESDARKNGRGLWAMIDPSSVDEWRAKQIMDAQVLRDGLKISIDPQSGLVSSGMTLHISPSVPSRLFMSEGTGAFVSFSGSAIITHDANLAFYADYDLQTMSGATVRSSVAIREYELVRAYYQPCILISEIYPSPGKGEQEWLELYNTCDERMSLLGWSIDDEPNAGSKEHVFTQKILLEPYSYTVLSGSLLPVTLNNSKDAVVLRMPSRGISDSMWYPSIPKGKSFARVNETFCKTDQPTYGLLNTCIIQEKRKTQKKSTYKPKKIGLSTTYSSFILHAGSGSELANKNISFDLMKGLNVNSATENNSKAYRQNSMMVFILSGAIILFLCTILAIYLHRQRS